MLLVISEGINVTKKEERRLRNSVINAASEVKQKRINTLNILYIFTQDHGGDVHIIKVFQSSLILQFVLSVLGQPLKERLLLVVALLYQALREVLYSVLQELI